MRQIRKLTGLSMLSLVVIFVALVVAMKVSAAPYKELPVNDQPLAAPYASKSVSNSPRLVKQPKGVELKVPAGFVVKEYMSGFGSPRFMLAGKQDEFLLSDTFDGKVYVVKDKAKKVLIKNLNNPFGLAFYQDWLYVAETNAVRRYKYNDETLTVSSERETVIDMSDFNSGHVTRSLLFDDVTETFYLSIGSRSNVAAGEPALRAAVSTFKPDGSEHQIYASGIRNAVGMAWSPTTPKQLWATSHERDGLGDELVPDYLTSVKAGEFFGWPYAYIGPNEDPRHAGVAPNMVAKTRYPDVLLGSHVGAMSLIFYTAKQFPERYRSGCFIALHGSWNRSQRAGYKIVFVPFKGGKPTAGPEDFLSGWMLSPTTRNVWGRPVGLLLLKDGSVLISDDGAGKLWRVSYEGNK